MSFDAWSSDPQEQQDPTWGDYGKAVGAGAATVASNAAAGLRYFYEQGKSPDGASLFGSLQGIAGKAGEDLTESMTPEGRDRLSASITSEKFWEHPLSSAALKTANMSPMVAAAILPGGLVADATAAAVITAGAGGALNAAGLIDEIYKKTDAKSDEELKEASTYYAGLRATFDEKEARRQYNEALMGLKPAIAFAIGAGVGAFGPAGNVVRGVKGEAAHGVVPGAVEGAASLAAQSGSTDYMVQNAEIEGGIKKDFDKGQLVDAVLEGGAFGTGLGAAGGAVAGRGKGKAKADQIKAKITPEVTPEDVNVQTQNGRTGGESPPVEAAPVGDKQNQPTRSETQYPKAEAVKGRGKGKKQGPVAEVVEPGAPTIDEKIAIADLQQKAQPEIPDVPVPVQAAPAEAQAPTPEAQPSVAPPVPAEAVAPRVPEAPAPAPVVDRSAQAPADIAPTPRVEPTTPVPVEIVPSPKEAVATPKPVEPVKPAAPEVKRAPRILEVIKDKATKEAESKAAKEAFRGLNKNVKDNLTEKDGEVVGIDKTEPKGSKHLTNAEKAAIADSATKARELFDRHVPDNDNIPSDAAGREKLRKRLGAMLDEAKENNVKIPTKTYESTADHVVYMRDAADLFKLLGQKSFTGARATKRITDFMVGERAAKKGDFTVMRERRKVEGDVAKRQDQGDVEQHAATSAGGDVEKDAVVTAVPKSGKGPVRVEASEEKVAGAGRKLEGEEKAKAIAELNERLKKGKVDLAATRTEAPAAKPPAATSDKVVTEAAKKTNTEPSDAQKSAGNYSKGTVEWNGLHIAIENPKGSVRKGKGWSVEMQDHYGYVKRSEGADGDQVDVFVGPNPKSDQVWVIHQQDFNGKFDEHKAMLGFDSQADAMQAYDRAFSDGRGFERLKDIEPMSAAEFKEWVKSDKPKKAKKEADESTESALDTGIKHKLHPYKNIDALQTIPARQALESLKLDHLTGVPKAMADLLINRLKNAVGDTPVHIVDKANMAGATGDYINTRGLHSLDREGTSNVYVRADQLANPEHTAHVVMHELAHVLSVRGIIEDAALRSTVRLMMNETVAHMRKLAEGVDGIANAETMKYALSDTREFVAEAFSNPKVQNLLAQVPMSPELAKLVRGSNPKMSLWDAFVHVVRKAIEKVTGPLPKGDLMIEGIIRLGNRFEAHERKVAERKARGEEITIDGNMTNRLIDEVKRFVDERIKGEGLQEQAGKPHLALRTMDQIAQVAGDYFRGNNPVRRVADIVEMMRVKSANNLRKAEPIVDKLYSLEKKYKGDQWDEFTKLVHDETMANVFADRDLKGNAHLGKDTMRGVWGKAQHADLARRWRNLPQDLKDARAEAMKFFTNQQNAMSLGIIKNRILKALGVNDDELARRIHEGRTLDTDADLVGGQHTLDLIKEAKELAKIEGPYFPLMRRGDHVVRATYDITPPKNATKIEDNVFEFGNRKEALKWAAAQDSKPSIQSRWVDKNTGDTHFPDGTKVTKNDTDAVQRFRVTVQNQHVEFFDSARAAQQAAFDLAKQGNIHVKGVEERRFEPGDRQADMLSHQMKAMVDGLKRREGYKDMTAAQKNELVQALNEASIRFLGSTRIQSRRLPRRYVEGASNDLTRNTLEYAQSSAGYLAKLEHQPDLEAAMKAMRDAVGADDHKTHTLGRSAIANEVEKRVAKSSTFDEGGAWNAATKRIMTLSFLDKLAGPSHNIINSLQPSMVTFPVLAARYGVGRGFDALSRAYRDVAGLGIVKSGVKDTIKKIKDGSAKTTDLLGDIKKNLSTKEREMIDYLAERGSIDPDAGFEVDRLIKSREGLGGRLDAGLGKFEAIARQMPQAIEMMNRSVSALATYRLEIARGASHEKAMVKAQETVNNTQGLYSASNSAPIFNHPVAKLALQFKKYGQMMYHLLGSNIGKALRNAEPGDRAEALRTLAGLTATHVAMAGALGLPTEPFKYLLMGAQAAGLTSTGWGDVENKVREQATNWFGKTGGEIATKGLPRLLGIDLSSRVGLDSMSSFGEPKSNKDSDVKSWMFDTLAGAPVALVSDWVKGMNNLWSGNFTKAAEQLVPMKFAADSIKAYRLSTEGKKGSTGKETMAPYNPLEAAVRVAGFTPAREAEEGAKRAAFYSNQKHDSEERSALTSAWVSAKPQDKFDAWKKIQSFNKGKSRDQQIAMSDLTRAADRRRKEGDKIKTTKRDQEYLQRAEATYNTR